MAFVSCFLNKGPHIFIFCWVPKIMQYLPESPYEKKKPREEPLLKALPVCPEIDFPDLVHKYQNESVNTQKYVLSSLSLKSKTYPKCLIKYQFSFFLVSLCF